MWVITQLHRLFKLAEDHSCGFCTRPAHRSRRTPGSLQSHWNSLPHAAGARGERGSGRPAARLPRSVNSLHGLGSKGAFTRTVAAARAGVLLRPARRVAGGSLSRARAVPWLAGKPVVCTHWQRANNQANDQQHYEQNQELAHLSHLLFPPNCLAIPDS
jgi:hypothetical protein